MKGKGKLLITGAGGFTGRHACTELLLAGYEVTAAVRKPLKGLNKGISIIKCELTDKEQVFQAVKSLKPDYVLHLAGQNHAGNSWSDPLASIEANTMATAFLIEAVRLFSPDCRMVIAGSALEFDPADFSSLTSPYSLSKTMQVLTARSFGALYQMDIIIVRPSNLIGPGVSSGVCSIFAKRIAEMEQGKAERVLKVQNLQAKRAFLDVRDAVSAYHVCLSAGRSGEVYDVTSEEWTSLGKIITLLKKHTAVEFEVEADVSHAIEAEPPPSAAKLKELGWKPAITLETSLKEILQYSRKNP
ncbi:NAD-dependent epimerase/dehydratase family protein [Metabacillus sp. GX 13764]|uniref:NAD-dependent epimerase/dehydratase family protein n=1 Tax=Metabacillus kandeliae TaxID=2900151 RepID=UPI001E38A69C|nr:NAD-dependent epimerase/dehydratase family protein [Metabacillus kandeliae]MCD7032637.1 NAD-dependent epimerase/dehydratase family protein [Metabacillus kandeliae]